MTAAIHKHLLRKKRTIKLSPKNWRNRLEKLEAPYLLRLRGRNYNQKYNVAFWELLIASHTKEE